MLFGYRTLIWGGRGRPFKSGHSDQKITRSFGKISGTACFVLCGKQPFDELFDELFRENSTCVIHIIGNLFLLFFILTGKIAEK